MSPQGSKTKGRVGRGEKGAKSQGWSEGRKGEVTQWDGKRKAKGGRKVAAKWMSETMKTGILLHNSNPNTPVY